MGTGQNHNKSQSGLWKDRNIMDGVMVLHEILHDTRIKKDGLVLVKCMISIGLSIGPLYI
jgi:hypothetical protein